MNCIDLIIILYHIVNHHLDKKILQFFIVKVTKIG